MDQEPRPTITERDGRVKFVSRIQYEYGSPEILQIWRERGPQVICDNAAFVGADGVAETWGFHVANGDHAIIELTYEGPSGQRNIVAGVHDMFVRAHLAMLPGATIEPASSASVSRP